MKFFIIFIVVTWCHHIQCRAQVDDFDRLFQNLEPIKPSTDFTETEEISQTELINTISENNDSLKDVSSENSSTSSTSQPNLTNKEEEELTKIFSPSTKEQRNSSKASTYSIHETNSTTSLNDSIIGSSTPIGVVLIGPDKPIPVLFPKTLIQKALEWMNDTYALSIALPIVAGVIFALTIITTLAACNWCKRRCRRRRMRKKILGDVKKNGRHNDRARLLSDQSDEEF